MILFFLQPMLLILEFAFLFYIIAHQVLIDVRNLKVFPISEENQAYSVSVNDSTQRLGAVSSLRVSLTVRFGLRATTAHKRSPWMDLFISLSPVEHPQGCHTADRQP